MLLSGKQVNIIFKEQIDGVPGVFFDGKYVRVHARSRKEGEEILYRWVKKRAALAIKQSVWHQGRKMGLNVDHCRIHVRDQKSRWGSCSTTGVISFNFRIALAPKEVMDYVVLHELVHLSVRNHSRRFWAEVERHCPDYRLHKRWLKLNADRLKSEVSIAQDAC